MSLDGLRAWIGEVERKLSMRTRVFLVLTAIAIGGAVVGIYLAIDAKDSSVSKAEVENVREELEARIGEPSEATDVTQLESELATLRGEVAELRSKRGGSAGDGGTGEGSTLPGGNSTEPGGGSGGDGASGQSPPAVPGGTGERPGE